MNTIEIISLIGYVIIPLIIASTNVIVTELRSRPVLVLRHNKKENKIIIRQKTIIELFS